MRYRILTLGGVIDLCFYLLNYFLKFHPFTLLFPKTTVKGTAERYTLTHLIYSIITETFVTYVNFIENKPKSEANCSSYKSVSQNVKKKSVQYSCGLMQ